MPEVLHCLRDPLLHVVEDRSALGPARDHVSHRECANEFASSVGLRCVTVSHSNIAGTSSRSSTALQIVAEFRSSPGRVASFPSARIQHEPERGTSPPLPLVHRTSASARGVEHG